MNPVGSFSVRCCRYFRAPSSSGPWSSILPNGTCRTGSPTHLAKAGEVESLHHGRDLDHTVEVIHSKLERHGERYEQLPALFGRPGAWQGILGLYAGTYESEAANAAKEGE